MRRKSQRTQSDISAIMRRVRSRNTAPEILFRRKLWERGVRYRLNCQDLPGKPDVVVRRHQLAIFIDGDFWHGNQWRRRKLSALEQQFSVSQSREYWLAKIRRNMRRDALVTNQMLRQGWTVLRFWESQVGRDVESCVQMTLRVLESAPASDSAALLPAKTAVEFFTGAGLMRLGLERQGWTVRIARDPNKSERSEGACAGPGAHFLAGAILPSSPDETPGVSLVAASFPGGDLSLPDAQAVLAGQQPSAFRGFIELLEGMATPKPPLLLLELAAELLTSHGGADFRSAMLTLNGLGYRVDPFILDATSFVPQSRHRLYVVGALDSPVNSARARESPDCCESEIRPRALVDFIMTELGIRWDIRPLPAPPERDEAPGDIPQDTPDHLRKLWVSPKPDSLLSQMSAHLSEASEQKIVGPEDRPGAAVCPPVIEWIAENYLNPLVNEIMRGRPLRSA